MSRLDELRIEHRSIIRRREEGTISPVEYLRRTDEILNEKLAYFNSPKTVEAQSEREVVAK